MKWTLLTILMVLSVFIVDIFSNEGRGEEMISFSVEKLKDVYSFGESIPVTIKLKNNANYSIKLYKSSFLKGELLFELKLSKKSVEEEAILPKIISAVDPSNVPAEWIILKPKEEYSTELNIAELVRELKLKPGIGLF